MNETILTTDVLVIGAGGAGFRAAIAAREQGVDSILLSKGPLARCGASPMAGADFTLDGNSMNKLGRDGDPNDSKEKVFSDIVTQGYFLNNQKLVQQYVDEAPGQLKDLMDWGLEIKMSDQRMVFFSGLHLMDVLKKRAAEAGVVMMEDIMVIDLLKGPEGVSGAVALNVRTGEFLRFRAKSVVMATGGWHKGFWPNTGMRDLSGEGIVMAHRSGADIGNMEFITFCANVMYEPPMCLGSLAPYMVSLICGGTLTDKNGTEILADYDPYLVEKGTLTEWNKSFISYISRKTAREGNGLPNGGIHYSRGSEPWEKFKLICSFIFPDWQYKQMDLTRWGEMLEKNEPLEVGPAVEYFEGGIIINEKFETGVPGLFAAGECALGDFGANRVFAAITEMLVHGKDAGRNASAYAKKSSLQEIDKGRCDAIEEEALTPLSRKKGVNPAELRRKFQIMAHDRLGPIRNENELKGFINELERVKKDELKNLKTDSPSMIYNKQWLDAIEVENIVYLLEAAARSALARTESRGVHFREDFPDTDNDTWLRESIVKRRNGSFTVEHRPVTVTSMSLPGGKVPYLDMMKLMMEAHSDTGGKH